jgi:hypothetical protein
MIPIKYLAIAGFMVLLGGCEEYSSDAQGLLAQNPPPPDTAPGTSTSLPPPPNKAVTLLRMAGTKGLMRAALPEPTCAQRVEAYIAWDATPTGQAIAELWLGPEGRRQLVARGASKDKMMIPGWAAPGQVFTLRAKGGEPELDQLVLPGKACS